MFKIIKDGALLAMTEAPTYIRRHENGCFVLCTVELADGIAHMGTVYHLLGCPEIEGAETVMLEVTDAGAILVEASQVAEDVDAMNVDHELRITMLELGGV